MVECMVPKGKIYSNFTGCTLSCMHIQKAQQRIVKVYIPHQLSVLFSLGINLTCSASRHGSRSPSERVSPRDCKQLKEKVNTLVKHKPEVLEKKTSNYKPLNTRLEFRTSFFSFFQLQQCVVEIGFSTQKLLLQSQILLFQGIHRIL